MKEIEDNYAGEKFIFVGWAHESFFVGPFLFCISYPNGPVIWTVNEWYEPINIIQENWKKLFKKIIGMSRYYLFKMHLIIKEIEIFV